MIKHDAIEKTPAYVAVKEAVDEEAWAVIESRGFQHEAEGSLYDFREEKARILRERHGINWRSPGRMNPSVIFD